jgi:glycosyltransferase involved in cell wall biosynthesis
VRAFFFWERVGGLTLDYPCNPYAGLLARALEKRDIHLELGDYALDQEWLRVHRTDYEVLHLNWLHHFYRRENLETTVQCYTRFAENLNFARSLGYRIVWTMHNLYPHERPFPEVDHLARLLVCQLADAVIAHCEYAAGLARRLFYRSGTLRVIPHGNFIDAYPNVVSREEARRRLDIPETKFVYLFFGNARAYKGIERLMETFRAVAEEDAVLVLMTRWGLNPAYGKEIEGQAGQDGRIRIFTSSFFQDNEFQVYLNAADVVVLPFVDVLTSGSAITAMSFGKPVILPRLGCLPELADDTMGLLYDPARPGALEEAFAAIRGRDLKAAGCAALARARALDWEGIASQVAEVYDVKCVT